MQEAAGLETISIHLINPLPEKLMSWHFGIGCFPEPRFGIFISPGSVRDQ